MSSKVAMLRRDKTSKLLCISVVLGVEELRGRPIRLRRPKMATRWRSLAYYDVRGILLPKGVCAAPLTMVRFVRKLVF